MKHPFQIITTDAAGRRMFASVKNHLLVFDLALGQQIGAWEDDVDIFVPLKKQQEEKVKQLQSDAKRAKTNGGIKVPKIPVPGPGAPPIYNYIRSLTLTTDEKFLVGTTDSDKAAIVFSIDYTRDNCINLVKRQVFPKRPCAVSATLNDKLVVADKFGDVYEIPIDAEQPVDEKTLKPLLGHVSMLLDVLVTNYNDKYYVITGDRDEHIRVTHYPKTYVIKDWLFGHREFVSSLHIPEFDKSLLVSAGGDDFVAVWKWFDNKLLHKVDLRQHIAKYLTDAHYPPERFLTDESVKEISVAKVLTHGRLLIVLVENTPAILTFELGDEVVHKQTLETSAPVVDLTLANDVLIASLESDKIVEFYDLRDGQIVKKESDVADKIADKSVTVESRKDFYPLYYINSLRKRSEH